VNRKTIKGFLGNHPEWHLSSNGKALTRACVFNNFREALAFVRKVGKCAESLDHHPDIALTKYRHVKLRLTTHAVHAITKQDLLLAAQVERVYQGVFKKL